MTLMRWQQGFNNQHENEKKKGIKMKRKKWKKGISKPWSLTIFHSIKLVIPTFNHQKKKWLNKNLQWLSSFHFSYCVAFQLWLKESRRSIVVHFWRLKLSMSSDVVHCCYFHGNKDALSMRSKRIKVELFHLIEFCKKMNWNIKRILHNFIKS